MMKVKKLKLTCGACPTQYDIWLEDGRYLYFRYRHGRGYIELEDREIIHEWQGDDPWDGVMTHEEALTEMRKAGLEIDEDQVEVDSYYREMLEIITGWNDPPGIEEEE